MHAWIVLSRLHLQLKANAVHLVVGRNDLPAVREVRVVHADAGDTSNGWYGLASYLFPQVVGIGKFQILAKYARAKYEFDASPIEDVQKTKDFELNYVIKAFNARVSVYYTDFTYSRQIVATDHKVYGVGLQLQM